MEFMTNNSINKLVVDEKWVAKSNFFNVNIPLLTLSAFDIANENTERNKISDYIFLMTCFCWQLK
jgi:hypothetical protein